jgi:tripartite-type tricarboxylate transporter receptor subunit TctC
LSVLIPAVALLLGMGGAAIGQQYPSRPIRLVVPFPPGGSIDMLSRVLADRLADRLGQPFVVENKAGASGAIGAEFVARAAPDGYTLLTAPTSVYAVGTALNSKMPFDLQKDLAPISTVGITEQSLNVNAALPVTSPPSLRMPTPTPSPTLSPMSSGTVIGWCLVLFIFKECN